MANTATRPVGHGNLRAPERGHRAGGNHVRAEDHRRERKLRTFCSRVTLLRSGSSSKASDSSNLGASWILACSRVSPGFESCLSDQDAIKGQAP
jgi:hypothetical protein